MIVKKKSIPRYTPVVIILSFIIYCIEIDLAVPSFPLMKDALQTTESLMQLTLSINFFGFCLGALLYGPLSDSFGRRPIILIGCTIYVIGGIGCAVMNSIEALLFFRFVQGLGASSGCVILYAMIADIYPPQKMAWFHGLMNAILTIIMAGAPMVGSLINLAFGWRYPLITIAVLSALTLIMMIFVLPETRNERSPWHIKSITRDYFILLKNQEFMFLALGPSVLCGVYFTFVSTASFFYQEQLHLSITDFAFHQGCVLAGFSLVSVLTGKINKALGMLQSIRYGNFLTVIGAVILLLLGFYPMGYPYTITVFMTLHAMGIALSFGTTVAIAFNVKPEMAGSSSSLMMASRLFFCSAMVAYASGAYDGTWLSVGTILVIGGIIGCFLIARGIAVSKSPLLNKS